MPLLILDRDGVINHDSENYIRSLADWQPVKGSVESIARLSRAGFRVVIATNQSGLSRGYFTLDDLEAIHQHLCQLVEEQGGTVTGIFYCPHLPDEGCACRKPGTGLLDAIAAETGESVSGCYFVGDSLKDLQAARARDCQPVLVLTGKGEATLQQLQAGNAELRDPQSVPVYNDLAEFTSALLSD